jgi:hypothetical protein
MHGRLLVAHQDVLEPVLLEDLVVDVENRAPGVPENVLHAFFGEATDDDLGPRDGLA